VAVLLCAEDGQASALLKHLRVRDIVAFHLSSAACHRFCRSQKSSKLIVPVLVMHRRWLRHVDLPSVEVLYADDQHLVSLAENEDFCGLLAACGSLSRLYCSHNAHLMAATFARTLAGLTGLIDLDVAHNRLAVDDRFGFCREQPLAPLFTSFPPHLRILDLSHNLLRDEHAEQLVEALEARYTAGGQGLEQLVMRSNFLGDTAGFAFGQLLQGPAGAELRRLDVRTNRVDEPGACAMLKPLKVHPKMREIRVGFNRQNTKQCLEVSGLACLLLQRALSASSCRLELLDLNNVRIGDEGVIRMAVALAVNNLLRRLDVAFNAIGPDGAKALGKALEQNHCLKELDLRDNEVGDDGAEALAKSLRKNYALVRVKLARNGISARGAIALRSSFEENSQLAVDFGASGAQLQGMVRRTPRMADLQLMRHSLRDAGVVTSNFASV